MKRLQKKHVLFLIISFIFFPFAIEGSKKKYDRSGYCYYCKELKKSKTSHQRHCKKNPLRVKRKKNKSKDLSGICRYCGLPYKMVKIHEKYCNKNPQRKKRKKYDHSGNCTHCGEFRLCTYKHEKICRKNPDRIDPSGNCQYCEKRLVDVKQHEKTCRKRPRGDIAPKYKIKKKKRKQKAKAKPKITKSVAKKLIQKEPENINSFLRQTKIITRSMTRSQQAKKALPPKPSSLIINFAKLKSIAEQNRPDPLFLESPACDNGNGNNNKAVELKFPTFEALNLRPIVQPEAHSHLMTNFPSSFFPAPSSDTFSDDNFDEFGNLKDFDVDSLMNL